MTQMQWYVLDQSQNPPGVLGPFDRSTLESMVWEDEVDAGSLVARVGASGWTPAGDDPELRSMFAGGVVPPPAAPPAEPGAVAIGGHASTIPLPEGDFRIGSAFSLGWATFTKGYGHLLLCVLILGLCYLPVMAPSLVGVFMEEEGKRTGDGSLRDFGRMLAACSNCLSSVIWPVFAPALIWPAVTLIRGEARLSDVFAGARRYLGILGTTILWGLAAIGGYLGLGLIALVGGLLVAVVSAINQTAGGIVGIILIVPAVAVLVVFLCLLLRLITASSFSYVLLLDPRESVRGGFHVMGIAWRMANVNKGRPMATMLLAGLLAALSIVLVCVGYLFLGLPLFIAVMGAAYELARREEEHARVRTA